MKRLFPLAALVAVSLAPQVRAGEYLWALENTSSPVLRKVDLQTAAIAVTVDVTQPPASLTRQEASGVGLGFAAGRALVLVSNTTDQKVVAYDRASGAYVGSYSTTSLGGSFASGIGWNGGTRNLLTDSVGDQAVVVDTEASLASGRAVAVSNVLNVAASAGFDVRGDATGLGAGRRFFVGGAAKFAGAQDSNPGGELGICELELAGQVLSVSRLFKRTPETPSQGILFGTGTSQVTSQPAVSSRGSQLLIDDAGDEKKLAVVNLDGAASGALYTPLGALAGASEAFADDAALPYLYMLPSAAKAPGANGAFYVSDLTVSNLSEGATRATIEFLEHDKDNSVGAPSATVDLAPGEARLLADVLGSSFSQTNNYGALRIRSSAPLNIACNTYLSGNPSGTFGQSLPAVDLTRAAAGATMELEQLDQNPTTKRSNLVVANPGSGSLTVRADFLDNTGAVLGTQRLTVPPASMVQLSQAFVAIGVDSVANGRIRLTSASGGVFAAAAYVIDRGTNDPFAVVARAVAP